MSHDWFVSSSDEWGHLVLSYSVVSVNICTFIMAVSTTLNIIRDTSYTDKLL